jgi:Predicted hydrolases or acyltransferases (alpha/beta hydrolase superfamily)
MNEQYITVAGRRVRLIAGGSGKPLVLLHGWSFNAETWVECGVFDALARRYAVYAVDMPYGVRTKSDRFHAPRPEYARFLRHVLDALGLADPPLVGPSASGEVVLWYLAQRLPAKAAVVVGPVGLVGELLKALEEVETPILAVWGELDEISPPSNAQVLRGRNVKTAMLRGAGHAAYLDKPKEFVELLLEFLGSVY